MNPLDWYRRWIYRQRYEAAVLVFASAYTYLKLDAAEQRRVIAETEAQLRRGLQIAAVFRRYSGWHSVAQLHALSMARLGIPPLLITAWPARLARQGQLAARRSEAFRAFRATGAATDDAMDQLRRQVPDLDAVLPSTLDDPVITANGLPRPGRQPVKLWQVRSARREVLQTPHR